MPDLAMALLPTRPEVTVEIVDIPTDNPDQPFWEGRRVGIQLANGRYDPAWGVRDTFTEQGAYVLAGLLAKASGLPVRSVGRR